MLVQRQVVAALGLAVSAASCGSDPVAGPTLDELRGEWAMSWTESGEGVACAWSDVTLSLRDSTKGPAGFWGGGEGSCNGLVENDNLTLLGFVVESLAVQAGHIRFVPRESTYRFEGSVTGDEMNGTMSANPFYVDVGVQVRTSGRWRAVRVPEPE